jgi:hypothetical protein
LLQNHVVADQAGKLQLTFSGLAGKRDYREKENEHPFHKYRIVFGQGSKNNRTGYNSD